MSSSKEFLFTPAQVGISSASKVLQTASVSINALNLNLNKAGLVTVRVTAYDSLGQTGTVSNGFRVWSMTSNMWLIRLLFEGQYTWYGWELFSNGICELYTYDPDTDEYQIYEADACSWSRIGNDVHVSMNPYPEYTYECGAELGFDGTIEGTCEHFWYETRHWFTQLSGWVDNEEPL